MNTSQQLKKAVLISHKTNLILQEILGVLANIKPCLTVDLDEKEKEIISEKFPDLAIECKKKFIANHQITVCAISKKRQIAKEVLNFFAVKEDRKRTGELLGYPECCIKNHLYFVHPKITYHSYINSKKQSFLTNNLLNFSTRLEKKENFEELKRYHWLNRNFPLPLFYLQFISHIPCSYDCQESIKIGKRIQLLLKEYAPAIEKVVSFTLSKPLLFFDLFKWVIFDGHFEEGTLFYEKVIPPISLIDFSLLNKIKEGNKIIIDDNKIKIFKDRVLLYQYLKKDKTDGFILDFK